MQVNSAQVEIKFLKKMMESYEAYFEGKQAGMSEEHQNNPYPKVAQSTSMPTPHEMWIDGYEESKNSLRQLMALESAATMLNAMRDLFELFSPERDKEDEQQD